MIIVAQIQTADQGSYNGQRLPEEPGLESSAGACGVHVPRGISQW